MIPKSLTKRRARTLMGKALVLLWLPSACAPTTRSPATPRYTVVCDAASLDTLHSLLFHSNDVLAVETLVQKPVVYRWSPQKESDAVRKQRAVGAHVLVRPTPGLTAELLEYTSRCDNRHASASSGLQAKRCPLELAGSTIEATSTGSAFTIDVTSDDRTISEEIIRRAHSLSPGYEH